MIITWLNCTINWIFSVLERQSTINLFLPIASFTDINNKIMSNNDTTDNI